MRNLVENAVAYGRKADVRITDTGDGYDVLVEDEGPGIPENDRQRVFEPFVRLESSRNEFTGGTGLGLTLVKAIAEGHGGDVHLENRPGGGLGPWPGTPPSTPTSAIRVSIAKIPGVSILRSSGATILSIATGEVLTDPTGR